MCDPASLSLAVMGAGAASSAIGSYNQAKGQKQAYNYQAAIDQQNVTIAKAQSSQALLVGQNEEQTQQLKNAQMFSTQRAAMASNGIDISQSGSAIDVLSSTKYLGTRDALTIHDSALRQAWGYDVQANTAQNSANFMSQAAKNISPVSAAFSSVLGSAGSVAQKWYSMDSVGATSGAPSLNDNAAYAANNMGFGNTAYSMLE